MSTSTLILVGAIGAILLTTVSSVNWRIAIRAALVLVLLEGAVRKWILPGASDLVYFAKDFVILGAYIGFYRDVRVRSVAKTIGIPISLIQICLGVIILGMANPNIGSLTAAALGARGYLFYLPLMVVVPRVFDSRAELIRNLTYYTLIAIPICLLGFLQFRSDSFSVLNTYAAGTSEYGASTFGVSEKVRITGTFSYLSGHVAFVNSFFALTIALICADRPRFRWTLLFLVIPLLLANAFMSGSRASIISIAFIGSGFLLFSSFTNSRRFRRKLSILLFAGLIAVVATRFIFADAASNSMARMNGAGDTVYQRIFEQPMQQLTIAMGNGGMFGCGVGTTSPAVASLRARLRISRPFYHPGYYDSELGQIFAEIGLVGFIAWYCFRIAVLSILYRSYSAATDPTLKSLALAAMLIHVPFMLLSLVLNHVACVLVWSITGLGMIPLLRATGNPHR